MTRASDDTWPEAGRDLWNELVVHPGRLACILEGDAAESVLSQFAKELGEPIVAVGGLLTSRETAPPPSEVPHLLGKAGLLTDCEILFDPELRLNPIALFRGLARTRPRIVAWPGRLDEHYLVYSEPTRRDFFSEEVRDALVLHARDVQFPDQVPYTLERISP
jgi:hypothetical protein